MVKKGNNNKSGSKFVGRTTAISRRGGVPAARVVPARGIGKVATGRAGGVNDGK